MEEKAFLLKNLVSFQVNLIPLNKTSPVVFQKERTGCEWNHCLEEDDILVHLRSSNSQRAHRAHIGLPAETQTLLLDLSCREPQHAEVLHEFHMTRKSIIYLLYTLWIIYFSQSLNTMFLRTSFLCGNHQGATKNRSSESFSF